MSEENNSDEKKITQEEADRIQQKCDSIPDEYLIPSIQRGLTTVFKDSHEAGAKAGADLLKKVSDVADDGEGSPIAAIHGAIMIVAGYVLQTAPDERMAQALLDSAISAAKDITSDDDDEDASKSPPTKFKW